MTRPNKTPPAAIIMMVLVAVLLLLALGFSLWGKLWGKPQTDIETIGWQITKRFDGHIRIDCAPAQLADAYCFAVTVSPLQAAATLEQINWQRLFGAIPKGDTWVEAPEGGYLPFTIDGRNFAVIVTGGTYDVSAGVILALSRE